MDKKLKKLFFRSVALAMGIASLVLNITDSIESKSTFTLLSIGLILLAISEIEK